MLFWSNYWLVTQEFILNQFSIVFLLLSVIFFSLTFVSLLNDLGESFAIFLIFLISVQNIFVLVSKLVFKVKTRGPDSLYATASIIDVYSKFLPKYFKF